MSAARPNETRKHHSSDSKLERKSVFKRRSLLLLRVWVDVRGGDVFLVRVHTVDLGKKRS